MRAGGPACLPRRKAAPARIAASGPTRTRVSDLPRIRRSETQRSRRRRLLALLCVSVALGLAAQAAQAAPDLWIGFEDDASLRWSADRQANFDQALQAGATVARTVVYWYRVAPTRPATATSSFDPAYRWDDLDEFVRNAQERGLEVMLSIWGTPAWANGGKGLNRLPTRLADFGAFLRAVADRYSGRHPGFPFVRFYSIWNEPNLGQFLSPQYDAQGKAEAPHLYALLARAGYAAIKAASPEAQVAIGETSNQGRDVALRSAVIQETESPGKFAQLLAKERPRLRFDAWAQHPYPVRPDLPPLAAVRWPNVALGQLTRFGTALDAWFRRKGIPLWITEFAYQTRPESPLGVSYATQARYVRETLQIVRDDPRVVLLTWFTLRDDPTNLWKSGLLEKDGTAKPSYAAFQQAAGPLDPRSDTVTVKAGVADPVLRVSALAIAAHSPVGTPISVTYVVYIDTGQTLQNETVSLPLGQDGWLTVPLQNVVPLAEHSYRVDLWALDPNGVRVDRRFELQVAP